MMLLHKNFQVFLFVFSILVFPFVLRSQDLIKKKSKKEIECKITKKTNDSIFFSYQLKNQTIKSSLPLDSIQEYYFHYFEDSLPTKKIVVRNYDRFRFAADFGFGHRSIDIPTNATDNQKNMLEGLQVGFNGSASGELYLNKFCAIGIKASYFQTSNSFNISITEGYYHMLENIKHASSTAYIGPLFVWRLLTSEKKNVLWTGVSIGFVSYSESAKGNDGLYVFKLIGNNSWGGNIELGVDTRISSKIGIGISAYYMLGYMSSYELNKVTNQWLFDKKLNRIGITIGFRFYEPYKP